MRLSTRDWSGRLGESRDEKRERERERESETEREGIVIARGQVRRLAEVCTETPEGKGVGRATDGGCIAVSAGGLVREQRNCRTLVKSNAFVVEQLGWCNESGPGVV